MFFSKWLRKQKTNPRVNRCARRPNARFRPGLEILEDRAVPAVLNVTTALDEVNPNDGLLSLREAVQQANAANGVDTVVVPAGTYLLNGGDRLAVTTHMTITGAGAGATVIDGGGAHGVFQITDDDHVSISGVTIQGGWSVVGGAIACGNSELTIDHSTICGNSAWNGYGGGIIMALGDLTITDSTISNNSAAYAGGGIYCNGTNVSIDRCAVFGNSALFFADGGGMWAAGGAGGTVTVKDSTFSGNFAFGGGGFYGAGLTVDHSTFSGNSAVYGGGIVALGTVTIAQSTITGNRAESDGGGILANATMNIDHSKISGNTALRDGGGILACGTLTIAQSTISGNTAVRDGGGILGSFCTMNIDQSTISDNTAVRGGGLYAAQGTVEIDQSTLNDPIGGSIFNDNSTIHLKQTVVDGVLYTDQNYT
jgi:predicted outer membrane repeat protein